MPSVKSLLFDLFLVALATIAAAVTRDNFTIVAPKLIALVPYIVFTLSVAGLVLPLLGISRPLWQFISMRDGLRIISATVVVVLGAVAVGFVVNRLDGVARSLPVIQGLLIVSFLIGARVLTRLSHDRRVQSAPSQHIDEVGTVLVIGLNKMTELYFQCLAEFGAGRVRVAGLLCEKVRAGLSVRSHPVLGTPEQVASALRRLEVHGVFVDRILVAVSRDNLSVTTQDALSQIQETTTISVDYLVERMGLQSRSAVAKPATMETINSVEGVLNVAIGPVPYHRAKRLIDLVGSTVLLITLAPLFLLVGVLVAAGVGLPLVFWQQRPGLHGRPFKLYKFRTMAHAYDADGQRKPDGVRVSVVGDFLRRTRLDELPQLLNILKGDMSFVGPRPLLPVDQPIDSRFRLLVRPGLTGWAQIKGGRKISPGDKAALDMWYVRNMSLSLDLKIVLGTLPMLAFGERVAETAIVHARREAPPVDSISQAA